MSLKACTRFCLKRSPKYKDPYDVNCNDFASHRDVIRGFEHKECLQACEDCKRPGVGLRSCNDEFSSRFTCPDITSLNYTRTGLPSGHDNDSHVNMVLPPWSILLISIVVIVMISVLVSVTIKIKCNASPEPSQRTSGLSKREEDRLATKDESVIVMTSMSVLPGDGGIFTGNSY